MSQNESGGFAAALRARLGYGNVIASLALFIALGGTAAAAVTLGRDSVGSSQIRQDAVRSPELAGGAVRSSELRDEGIKIADVSVGAQAALRGELRVAEDDNADLGAVPDCEGEDLSVCPNHLALRLTPGSATVDSPPFGPGGQPSPAPPDPEPRRSWLIQAKLGVALTRGSDVIANRCGLVNTAASGPRAVLDEAQALGGSTIALSAVVKKGAGNPTVALRCTSSLGARMVPTFAKITALEVGSVTGP